MPLVNQYGNSHGTPVIRDFGDLFSSPGKMIACMHPNGTHRRNYSGVYNHLRKYSGRRLFQLVCVLNPIFVYNLSKKLLIVARHSSGASGTRVQYRNL